MPHLLGRLRTALKGRYTVEQELGRGGMAVVFLGRDLRLERRVAIKVFEHEGKGGPAIERFLMRPHGHPLQSHSRWYRLLPPSV